MSAEDIRRAWAKIAQTKLYLDVTEKDVGDWLEGEGAAILSWFRNHVRSLPQSPKIAESDILAWIWSFHHDPGILSLDDETARRFFLGAVQGMRNLSAYDAAVVAAELSGRPVWAFRDAETIRRNMLLKNVYARMPSRVENRLKAYAAPAMREAAWKTISGITAPGEEVDVTYGMESPWISAFGRRYAFFRRRIGKMADLWYPCIFTCDDDTDKDLSLELAALAAVIGENGMVGGALVCNVSPKDYSVSAKLVKRESVVSGIDEVREAAERFMRDHVIADSPVAFKSSGKIELSGAAAAEFVSVSEEMAKISALRKAAEKKESALRARLWRIVKDCAWESCAGMEDVKVPKSLVSMARVDKIDYSALDSILSRHPGAYGHIFRKVVPVKELMEKKLRELGVPEAEWCEGIADVNLIREFCKKENLVPPLKRSVCFRINTRSQKAKEDYMRVISASSEVFSSLGLEIGD